MDYVTTLSSALTPLIAIVVLYVMYQQYRANQQQVQMFLFDKRLALYQRVYEFIQSFSDPKQVDQRDLIKFQHEMSAALYLYDRKIFEFTQKLILRARELSRLEDCLSGMANCSDDEKEKAPLREREVNVWFSRQVDVARELFKPYLKLTV
ncbi:hypothetical protein HQ585_01130 [candidate division KSB1 bacterium]|nr:hypothetical protein [candidate division KSB1 bacterium]